MIISNADHFADDDRRCHWLERARELAPSLVRRTVVLTPPTGFLAAGDAAAVDAGRYLVGYVTLRLKPLGSADAPVRLRVISAEWPCEAGGDFSDYAGCLGRSWLQDEVVNIDDLTAPFTLPRRYAFRFIRIEVIYTPRPLEFTAIEVETVSAVGDAPPEPDIAPEFRAIDATAIRTLKWCMQSVFEDGPKRDRRLWLGDLRLQARVNAVSFRHFELVERSLYLLAGTADDEGRFPGCAYDAHIPYRGNMVLDYAQLLAPTLLDHLEFSGRRKIAEELFDLALRQFDFARPHFDSRGLFRVPEEEWIFIDWQKDLDRQMPFTGLYVYSLKRAARLAELLDRRAAAARLGEEAERLLAAARRHAWDEAAGAFRSGAEGQLSHATAAWMILAGALTPAEGRRAFAALEQDPGTVRPVTPYLWHHVLEAQLQCGMCDEAGDFIRRYWGGMIADGADTFYEAFVPERPELALYGDRRLNSACHAWSCTPAWFIRTAPICGQSGPGGIFSLDRRGEPVYFEGPCNPIHPESERWFSTNASIGGVT